MKKLKLVVGMFAITLLAGCAGNREAVLQAAAQTRQDVFEVVQTPTNSPGKALLQIEFPVKTFRARIANSYIKHRNPPYTAIVNMDGQAIELTAEPVLENLPGDFRDNPEAGSGWKYVFKRTLLLEPGTYRMTIAVPLAGVVVEKELTLTAGEHLLKIAPTYNASVTRYPNYPRFNHGLSRVAGTLNNREL